jgi:aspartate racemase
MLYYRLRSLPIWLQDFLSLDRSALLARLRYSSSQRLRLARLGMPLDVDDPVPEANGMPDHVRRIMELHTRASRQYMPLPYDGRLTLFNVRFQPLARTPDPRRGWGRLARGGVDVRSIAGAHYNILFPPHVPSLARALQECLAEARAAPIASS